MKKKLFILIVFLITTSVFSHEYILLAYDFFVKKGEKLELHLFVADGFNIEAERPFQESMTKNFKLISENGKTNFIDLVKDGNLPVLEIDINFEGLGLIHMQRDYARITMTNEKFKSYLKADNIENIKIDDTTKTEQTERYTRYIKTLIQSDIKPNDDLYSKEVGHVFEIVLLQNPYLLSKDDWLQAKILFNGNPLKNKAITARNRLGNESATYQYSITDEDGICSFKLERGGDWYLHSTHMIESLDKSDTDWESYWATFSFGMKE
jgi:uncharacterized GH25 family protein